MIRLSPRAIPLLFFRSIYDVWHNGKQYVLLMAGSGIAAFQNPLLLTVFLILVSACFTYLTLKHYKSCFYACDDQVFTLSCGVFNHLHVEVPKSQVERFEITQSLLERLLGLQTLLLFTRGSSRPAITFSYLTPVQRSLVSSNIPQGKMKEEQTKNVKARWLSAVFIGELYPYLTAGILVVTPLFLALNILHQPPNPTDAKTAVTDTIEMGLLPLLATLIYAILFYVVICLVGKWFTYAYLYATARFTVSSDLRIHGQTGMLKRREWSIHVNDIQYIKVDTLPVLEALGRFNVTLVPMGKTEVTMLIPGVDTQTLNYLLSLNSIGPLSRRALLIPSRKSTLLFLSLVYVAGVLPIYLALIYMLPAKSLQGVTLELHAIVLIVLLSLTAIWSMVCHNNNRVSETQRSVIVGARQVRRTYYCFACEKLQSTWTKTFSSKLWPYKSRRYCLSNKTITATFIPHKE